MKDEDTGMTCTPIETPKPQPPEPPGKAEPPGPTLGTSHARSECIDDFWHVVTDEDWIRPDGTHFKRRHQEKTAHSCKPGDEIPPELPGGTQPNTKGEKIEPKEEKECINGIWWYRQYPQYRKPDGSTWVDKGKDNWIQQYTKNEPCTGALLVPGVLKSSLPTGLYVGGALAINGSTVRVTETFAEGGQFFNDFDDSASSIGVGAVVGTNVTAGRFAVGPFASFDWRNQEIERTSAAGTVGVSTHWSVEAGAKVGTVLSGVYVYGLGSVGWLAQDLHVIGVHGETSDSSMAMGFSGGAGAEFGLGGGALNGWPVRLFAQYQFSNWQDATLTTPAASPSFNYTFQRHDQTIKFGILVPLRR